MAFKTGAVTAKFTADIKDFKRKMEELKSSVNRMSKAISTRTSAIANAFRNVSNSVSGTVRTLDTATRGMRKFISVTGGIATVIAGLGSAVTAYGITMGSKIQQTSIAFDTMLESADKRRKLMSEITEFAKTTPFERFELIDASKQLLAMGVGANKIIPTMKMLGDVSAGIGARVEDVAFVFSQVRAQGQAYTQDLNQFATRGIPIYDELAKSLGISVATLRDGMGSGRIQVSFDMINEAFRRMTSEGGKFNDLMKAQSRSLSGVLSNVKDSLDTFILRFIGITDEGDVKKGSIFAKAQSGASQFAQWLADNEESISQWGSRVFDTIGTGISTAWNLVIAPILKKFLDWFSVHGTQAIEDFANYISSQQFQDDVQKLVDKMNEVVETLIEVVEWAGKVTDFFANIGKGYNNFKENVEALKDVEINPRSPLGKMLGRENGGYVQANRMYEVGEKDKPELLKMGDKQYLIPGNNGTVIPNKDLQTQKVVNIYNYNGAYKQDYLSNSLLFA